MEVLLPISVVSAGILLLEWTMWRMFRRRIAGILFPRHVDGSHLRFFTLNRIRFCALLHTTFLLLIVVVTFLFAW